VPRSYYGLVSEKKGTFQYKANTKYEILVVFCNVLGSAGDEEVSPMNAYVIFYFGRFLFWGGC
jgi:hypothetical protein